MTALATHVLIADDEPSILDILQRVIGSMGLTPIIVADGAEAIAVIHTLHARLIGAILDIRMPEINGVDLAESIRQIIPDLPIVFISGGSPPQTLERAKQLPRSVFLQKPFI